MPQEEGTEGVIEHVEAAGIGAEGRHHQAVAVGGKAFPPYALAAAGDARHRMQMPRDLRWWRRMMPAMLSEAQTMPPIEAGKSGS